MFLIQPLKALEAYRLVIKFSRELADTGYCAAALCQTASILLDLGSPDLALVNCFFVSLFVFGLLNNKQKIEQVVLFFLKSAI